MKIFNKERRSVLILLYTVGFLFAFRAALPAYINSSFLTYLTNEKIIGVIYTIVSIITLTSFIFIPHLLAKIGNYKTTLYLSAINIISLFGLAIVSNKTLLIILFLVSYTTTTLTNFCIDIFLEHHSKDNETGRIRTFFLTAINIAWLFSPFIAANLLSNLDFGKIYLLASVIMIPASLFIMVKLKNFSDPEYHTFSLIKTHKEITSNKNISSVMITNFLLQLFYCWMVIYTPIYLKNIMGFSWPQIGIILTIMLLPFVLFQIPLGFLADKKIGEKEMLTMGFIIMAISTATMSFINTPNLIIWALLLFATRIGACTVEAMSEIYFFKRVNSKNINIISLFRMITPIAYVVGPILATIVVFSVPLKYIFFILGIIMLLGIRYSLRIKDTL